MSLTNNLKKIALDNSLDSQSNGQPKIHHKPKSRSIVKMPSINPSVNFNNSNLTKNALLKVSQRRAIPPHPTATRKSKPQSFSQHVGDEYSVASFKSMGSINIGKLKQSDIGIDTTSDGSKDLEELEGSDEPSPSINPIKKTLQILTANLSKGAANDHYSSFAHAVTEPSETKPWPNEFFTGRKNNSNLSSIAKIDKVKTHRPAAGKYPLINNSESTRITKTEKTQASITEEEDDFEIPNIGATKHSLRENGFAKAYAANTNQGLVRNYNEDRVSIVLNISKPADSAYQGVWPMCSFFAVYDGHGGDACSDFLRDNLHQMIVRNSSFPLDPISALRKGFAEAEAKFLEEADQEDYEVERSGSCAIVVLIVDDMCYTANVGDSRAILSCERGQKVINLSRDHKPSDPEEQARIVKHGGRVYQSQVTQQVKTGSGPLAATYNAVVLGPHRVFPGRLSVSRTFGDIEAKSPKYDGIPGVIIAEPEIKSFKITDSCDFIVLASDGIYDRLSSEDVSRCVWNSTSIDLPNIHQHAAAGVEYIMKQALLKKTTDNITAVVVALSGLKEATSHDHIEDSYADVNLSQLNSLKPKAKNMNENIDQDLDIRSVRSEKKVFSEIKKTDNSMRSKKEHDLMNKAEDMIYKKIYMANADSKKDKFKSTTNRGKEPSGSFFSSPRMLKLSKISFTSIK